MAGQVLKTNPPRHSRKMPNRRPLPQYILAVMTPSEQRRVTLANQKVERLKAKMMNAHEAASHALDTNDKTAQHLVNAGFKAEYEWFKAKDAAAALQDSMREKYGKH
jgi:hypothetical protein